MANWCYNILTVHNPSKEVIDEFKNMETEELTTGNGQHPTWYNNEHSRYLFNININHNKYELIVDIESKWGPPIDVIMAIAKKYNTSFTLHYEEMSCLYGYITYSAENGRYIDKYINYDSFNVEFDENLGGYLYDGDIWESREELYNYWLDNDINTITNEQYEQGYN
jgi:hypothetical protein